MGGARSATGSENRAGEIVGKCRLIGELGAGGFGVVWKAWHNTLEMNVAIKIMRSDLARRTEYKERFFREARTAARIDHPNVVRVLDCGEENGDLYLVMEYVDGTDLGGLLVKRPRLSENEALQIVRSVAAALCAAGKLGLVHRDIKPGNILLSADGRVKLSDLGLVKIADSEGDTTFTQSGVALGTPHYMSPEQIEDPSAVDVRSDIYSLGVAFYRMVTGALPFEGETPYKVMNAHLEKDLTPPDVIVTQLTHATTELILRMLAKKPADRFATAEELVAACDAALTGTDGATEFDEKLRRTNLDGEHSTILRMAHLRQRGIRESSVDAFFRLAISIDSDRRSRVRLDDLLKYARELEISPEAVKAALAEYRSRTGSERERERSLAVPVVVGGLACGLLLITAFLLWLSRKPGEHSTGVVAEEVTVPGGVSVADRSWNFRDDFDRADGPLGERWKENLTVGCKIEIENGNAVMKNPGNVPLQGGTMRVAGPVPLPDVEVSCRAKVSGHDFNALYLCARMNGYDGEAEIGNYSLDLIGDGIRIIRRKGNERTVLRHFSSERLKFEYNTYTLRVITNRDGNVEISAFKNNRPLGPTYVDSSDDKITANGHVAFKTNIWYKNNTPGVIHVDYFEARVVSGDPEPAAIDENVRPIAAVFDDFNTDARTSDFIGTNWRLGNRGWWQLVNGCARAKNSGSAIHQAPLAMLKFPLSSGDHRTDVDVKWSAELENSVVLITRANSDDIRTLKSYYQLLISDRGVSVHRVDDSGTVMLGILSEDRRKDRFVRYGFQAVDDGDGVKLTGYQDGEMLGAPIVDRDKRRLSEGRYVGFMANLYYNEAMSGEAFFDNFRAETLKKGE